MKKSLFGSIVAGAVLAVMAVSAQAQDKVYKIGIDQTDYPPFATKDTSGQWTGWEIDLAQAVCEAAAMKCEFNPTAWDGIIPALQAMAMGIANIVSILNPEIVVLGGGLFQSDLRLLEPVRARVARWAQPLAAAAVRIEPSGLGEDAGLFGAAKLAWDSVRIWP